MELRRAADALVRLHTSPLATFLAPSTTIRWTSQVQIRSKVASSRSMGRQFSCGRSQRVNWTPVTTATPPPQKESESSSSSMTPTAAGKESVEDVANALGWVGRRREPASSPSAAAEREEREKKFNGGTTASSLLAALNQSNIPRRPSSGPNSFTLGRMMTPGGSSNAREISEDVMNSQVVYKTERPQMKLGPSTGRTVEIGTKSVDIGRGFALLNMNCARNKVMRDLSRQRFHERPGLKRKRLRRERWRKRFMDGFQAAVKRVTVLKKQGW
jgi:small subunit ribosomal protein MRP21